VRARVMSLIALGLVFVFGFLYSRYRSVRLSLAAMLPAVLAAGFTLACFGWAGAPLNILHAIGLALVLSMGVDYGVFVVEGRDSRLNAARSLVSVFTATVTTILSFGALALSSTPALRALGLTITIGLLLSFLLCPSALVLLLLREEKA
jgi:predicted exporter